MNYNSEGDPNYIKILYRRAQKYFDYIELEKQKQNKTIIDGLLKKRRLVVKKSKENIDTLFADIGDKKKFVKILLNNDKDEQDLIRNPNWSNNLIR